MRRGAGNEVTSDASRATRTVLPGPSSKPQAGPLISFSRLSDACLARRGGEKTDVRRRVAHAFRVVNMNDYAQSKKNTNTPSAEREDCNRDTGPWRKGERESTCKAMLNVVKGMQRNQRLSSIEVGISTFSPGWKAGMPDESGRQVSSLIVQGDTL